MDRVNCNLIEEDVDRDGDVDINDVKELIKDIGKTNNFLNPKSDINKDGIVNLKDLILIAKKLN